MRMSGIALAFMLMLAPLSVAHAANEESGIGVGDARKARPLIAELCTRCHLVPGFPPDKLQPAVKAPPFSDIAANPSRYSDAAIARFLSQPHWPMQGIILSKRDIANIIAFFHELRTSGGK